MSDREAGDAIVLRTIALAMLIGFVSTAAIAQKPSPLPSPSPSPGTRAYTEQALETFRDAAVKYYALSADPNASLDALDKAFANASSAGARVSLAIHDEAEATADVKAAKERLAVAQSVYERAKGKDYENELKAESAVRKAERNHSDSSMAAYDKIWKALAGGKPLDVRFSDRHVALRDAKKKADAERRAQELQKMQELQKTEPKKTSCAPGNGLTGMTENIACQEQHSGSGH